MQEILMKTSVRTGRTQSSLITDQEFAPYGLKVCTSRTDSNFLSAKAV